MNFHATLIFAIVSAPAYAQSLMTELSPGSPIRLVPDDAAVLESHQTRTDLPCVVQPVAPRLGFDLKFHSGYDVTVPLQALAGQGSSLTAIFRVTPEERPDDPV